MSATATRRGVATLDLDVPGAGEGWEQEFLFISDMHWDSVLCNRGMAREHLEEARVRNAMVFILGDVFDAMQGRFDPRRSMRELRPEYRRDDYYDYIVSDLAGWLAPYAGSIQIIAKGNHESAVQKNAGTDLVERLVHELNVSCRTQILAGWFGGWIRLMINCGSNGKLVPQTSIKIKYFHGAGGEAPVTRGVIQTNRQAVYLPDADVVVNGHNHSAYVLPISRERISNKGVIFYDNQWHLRVPGYLQSYADGTEGWEVERGGVPKPLGCIWMKLTMNNKRPVLAFTEDIRPAEVIRPLEREGKKAAKVFAEDGEYP